MLARRFSKMGLQYETARYFLAIIVVMIGMTEVEPQYNSCSSYFTNQSCYNSRSTMCCHEYIGQSRCCRPTVCANQFCLTLSRPFCCSSACCDSLRYSSYSLSSSRSSWSSWSSSRSSSRSSRSSRSSSSSSYWSSWSSSMGMDEEVTTRNGIIAGSVVGGIVFLIFAVVIPVVVCRNAAARSNHQVRVTAGVQRQQTPYIAGVMPGQPQQTPAPAPSVQYSPPPDPGQQYHLQNSSFDNPAYQPSAPSYRNEIGQQPPYSAPPPSYEVAIRTLEEH